MPRDIVGTWVSDVRETGWGPLRFEFRFETDGRFTVVGTPVDSEGEAPYRRSGPYRLDGDRLITPALNEGEAVLVALEQGRLLLTINEGLRFRLRRE